MGDRNRNSVMISVSLPQGFLTKLDAAASDAFTSRSDYIRQAVIEKINTPPPPRHENDWALIDALAKEISDDELLEVIKVIKKQHSY